MTNWALLIFILGLLSFLLNTFNLFVWFSPFWGLIMMLVSLGMFTRIARKEREGEKEKLREMVEDLKTQLAKRGAVDNNQ